MPSNEVRAAWSEAPPAVGHSCSWGEAGRRHVYQTKWLTLCQDEGAGRTYRSFRFAFMWFPMISEEGCGFRAPQSIRLRQSAHFHLHRSIFSI